MSKIIGLNYGIHDNGASLVIDGNLVCAIEEEKMTGIKSCYNINIYPEKSLAYIEKEFGVSLENCDAVAASNPYFREFIKKNYSRVADKFFSYSHHDCHNLGSYLTSGFGGKVISLSHDGKGYRSRGKLYLCDNGSFEEIHTQYISTTASLAGIWGCATFSLGWKMLKDEGKVVGLAAHGKFDKQIYDWLSQCIYYKELNFKPANWESLYHYIFDTYQLKRFQEDEFRKNFAFTLQKFTEVIFGEYLKDLNTRFPDYKKLCLSGGLFANVKLNQYINSLDLFDEIFIHPSMGDGGLATGAALICAHERGEILKPQKLENLFLGESHSESEWKKVLEPYLVRIKLDKFSYPEVAKLIHEGNVIGCFFGKTEYGPRALGNRSIIVRPTDPDTHRKLNEKLKRTEIMPFAPSVLYEEANYIFDCDKSKYAAEFMTLCYNVRPEWFDRIPAVIQKLDSSARPQLVHKNRNPNFYAIIDEYRKISGIPVVLNTSFNAHGEPINNYPHQVLEHLLNGVVDFIATDYFIISKRGE